MYDRIDTAILASLRKNSARRLLAYTIETGIPKSTVHERIRRLMRGNVRCTSLIDFTRLGYSISVLFIVPFDESLCSESCVNSAQHITPNVLLLECVFRTMKECERFKTKLKAARYFTVIDVLKREGFVPTFS